MLAGVNRLTTRQNIARELEDILPPYPSEG
jgi:hypothetical protein